MNRMEIMQRFLNEISSLTPQTWLLLAPHTSEIELKKDDFFVKAGEVSREIGVLTKGIVRSFYVTEDGKEYNKTLFSAPNIIGSYVSLITGEPNRLPQQALTNCTVTKIPLSIIESLSEEHIVIERLRRKIAEHKKHNSYLHKKPCLPISKPFLHTWDSGNTGKGHCIPGR